MVFRNIHLIGCPTSFILGYGYDGENYEVCSIPLAGACPAIYVMESVDASGLLRAMIRRTFKWTVWLIIAFVVVNVFLMGITYVRTTLTSSDAATFRSVFGIEKPVRPQGFDDELKLIRSLQAQVMKRVPSIVPIPEYQSREPEDLFLNKSGLCYDRSRALDKLFAWYGFESRHIYILYAQNPTTGEDVSFGRAVLTRATGSHAVTEVKTSKGWIVVDSLQPWISVTDDGAPVDADHINEQAHKFSALPGSFSGPYWEIRGLYSRRGHFYRPYIPYPEVNWHDFISWLIKG